MLDEKDIEKIQSMIDQAKDDMLKQSAANTRVIIESSVMKKLDLLIEGQQSLLETLAPKSRVEELEEGPSAMMQKRDRDERQCAHDGGDQEDGGHSVAESGLLDGRTIRWQVAGDSRRQ